MSVMVIVQASINPKHTAEMKSYLAQILPDSRAFEGCQYIDVYFEIDNPDNMVLVEEWDSREDYGKYHAWRTETGVIDKIRSMVDGNASFKFCKQIDA